MGKEHLDAERPVLDSEAKPVIVLRPSELWEYHKNRLEWLRKQRDGLVIGCKRAAWDAVALRIPDAAGFKEGHRDTWNELDDDEIDRLYASILERLVESSGSSREFVLKLLPQTVKEFVLETVTARRRLLAVTSGNVSKPAAALVTERSYATGDPTAASSDPVDDSVPTTETDAGGRRVFS